LHVAQIYMNLRLCDNLTIIYDRWFIIGCFVLPIKLPFFFYCVMTERNVTVIKI